MPTRKNLHLIVSYLFLLALSICCGNALGEAAEEEFPFVAIVTGDNVNVRAGSNLNFEVLCQLNKEDIIHVWDGSFQWYKIELPIEGTCFVSKLHIEKEDGFGTSKVDRLNIRSRPDTNSTVIGQLKTGDRVAIFKELSQWYQIRPPQDCAGWIHSRFVNFYSTPQEYRAREARSRAIEEKFQKLSKRYKQESSKSSPEETELGSILAEFEKFATEYPDSEYLSPASQMIENIKLKIAQAQHIMATGRLEEKMKEVSDPKLAHLGPPCAEGRVEDVGRFFNRPGTHKLTKEGQVVCYLKSESLDLNKYADYQVCVWGETSRIEKWPHPIITVEDITSIK